MSASQRHFGAFRPRYRLRLRRAIPALVLLLALCVVAGGVWLRVLDRVGAAEAGSATCVTGPAVAGRVQLRVYNGTDREGLAKQVSDQLRGRGFVVLAADNDPLVDIRAVAGSAEVRYGPKGATQAELVRRQVPGAKLYRDVREDAVVDLALGAGYKRLSTQAELARGRQGIAAAGGGTPAPVPAPTC